MADGGLYPWGRKVGCIFFFFRRGGGLQVNEPYNWEGGLVSGRGGLETAVYGTWRIFRVFFFFSRIKETVLIWILELEVVKSQITV